MNTRFFKKVIPHSSHHMPQVHARYFSTNAMRPPVLLLAEVHSRPAARYALYYSLPTLKLRGYNMLMCEGMEAGTTLEEELAREKTKKKLLEKIYERNPALIELMNRRYQLNQKEFQIICSQLLKEASPSFNYSDRYSIIKFMSVYFESNISLYNRLIDTGFSYQNLDKDHSASIFRPLASRRDLDFRDEKYVSKISQAYKQGKNVISILGGLHILTDPQSSYLNNIMFGRRQLIATRLRARGIPCISLFPFCSSHMPATSECETWEKQGHSSTSSINPSDAYSVDISGLAGIERFLQIVDKLCGQNMLVKETHALII